MIRLGRRSTRAVHAFVVLAVALSAVSDRAHAASLRRAKIAIDATSAAPSATVELTMAADSPKPATSADLYLATASSITKATLEGQPVRLSSSEVPGASLRKWTLGLPLALTRESSRVVVLNLALSKEAFGVGPEDGGALLPGSGWFPSTSPNADAILPHSTSFVLAQGMQGAACGSVASPGGVWTATTSGRPFAVWGGFTTSADTHRSTKIEVWRRPGDAGDDRALDFVASIWERLTVDLGAPCGGSLRVVDVGNGVVAGGQNTLLWDESRWKAASAPPESHLAGRDVATALAASFWNDCAAFAGDDAGWLSRSIQEQVGDTEYTASLYSPHPEQIEAVLGESRRDLFMSVRSKDHALRGLLPASSEGSALLRSRGALVAHMIAESCPSRATWFRVLESSRSKQGEPITRTSFLAALQHHAANQHPFLESFLDGTALPDFRIVSHTPGQGPQKDRLRVEVENAGTVEGPIEVQIATAANEPIRSSRLSIPPKEKRAILFKDEGRAATIRLDPRSLMLQSDVSNDVVQLADASAKASAEPLIPTYPFEGLFHEARRVSGFQLVLEGVTISEFEGIVVPYKTSQGPNGATLLGTGRVQLSPPAPHREAWTKAVGRESLAFEGSEMWIRFPLAVWPSIEKQLGERVSPGEKDTILQRNRPVFEHSFPTHYSKEMRAEVPPPGGSLITFTSSGGELRGLVRIPRPDGRVTVRFWDQLSGATIWEDTR